jgi:hypothetical protein
MATLGGGSSSDSFVTALVVTDNDEEDIVVDDDEDIAIPHATARYPTNNVSHISCQIEAGDREPIEGG